MLVYQRKDLSRIPESTLSTLSGSEVIACQGTSLLCQPVMVLLHPIPQRRATLVESMRSATSMGKMMINKKLPSSYLTVRHGKSPRYY
jgi:hypothetical protein